MPTPPIVCPFCPLCCDDVVLRNDGGVGVDCSLAADQFAAAVAEVPVRFGSETITQDAIDFVITRLQLPAVPTVAIHNASLGESRMIQGLARQGKLLLATGSELASAWSLAVARDGIVTATLGDVLRFADLIVCIGEFEVSTPRLIEWLKKGGAPVRTVTSLDADDLASLQQLTQQDVGAAGSRPAANNTGATKSSFNALATEIAAARYVAFLVGADAFPDGQQTLVAEGLLRWVTDWNLQTSHPQAADNATQPKNPPRAVAVHLSDNQSLHHVIRFRDNRIRASELAFPKPATIRLGSQPTDGRRVNRVELQIGGVDPGPEHATAFLPAATPGVHVADATIRGDGSVTLPLSAVIASELPTRTELLQRALTESPIASRDR